MDVFQLSGSSDSSSDTIYWDFASEDDFLQFNAIGSRGVIYPTPRALFILVIREIRILFNEKRTKSALYLTKGFTLIGSLIGIFYGGKIGGVVGAIFGIAFGFGIVVVAMGDGFMERYGPDGSQVV